MNHCLTVYKKTYFVNGNIYSPFIISKFSYLLISYISINYDKASSVEDDTTMGNTQNYFHKLTISIILGIRTATAFT
jgi:hypothetical protein